ncbi:MAG: hypothetical protein ACFB3T_10580 [Geminicoccaceae bacterium]
MSYDVSRRAYDELAEQLAIVKKEVDGLQIAAAEERRPWYRKPSNIIAALALIISAGATWYNAVQGNNLHDYQLRDELRSAIYRLGELPMRAMDYRDKYGTDSAILTNVLGSITQETTLLVSRTLEIIDEIPHLVSPSEKLYIANALMQNSEPEKAAPLFEDAVEEAVLVDDALAAVRNLGAISFGFGDYERGRAYFREALAIFTDTRFADAPYHKRNYASAFTEHRWAQSERWIQNCDGFAEHMRLAEQYIVASGAMEIDPVRQDIAQTKAQGCPLVVVPQPIGNALPLEPAGPGG